MTPTSFTRIAVLYDPESKIHGDYEHHVYLVTNWIGSPINLSSNEHSELGWFEINEALKLNLAHSKYPGLFQSIEKTWQRSGMDACLDNKIEIACLQ